MLSPKYRFKNVDLGNRAVFALTNGSFESRPTYCLRFVRQVVENLQRKPWSVPRGMDAWEAAQELERQGYGVPLANGSRIGDLLFKAPTETNPHGHVGIRIAGNRVAENSSYHAARQRGEARGVRTLEEFGKFQKIIRLGAL